MTTDFSYQSLQYINKDNAVGIIENLYQRYAPIEQPRWAEWNIDKRFYAGDQRYINSFYGFNAASPNWNSQNFAFNIIQQPVNMVTGYQRQHRKNLLFTPVEGSDQKTADQWSQLITVCHKQKFIDEKFSHGCDESTQGGLIMAQPYLDFTEDPVNGDLSLRIWPGNSFLSDAYFKEPDMSDANFVWFQQYISKNEAILLFQKDKDKILRMSSPQGTVARGKFYFLPENYSITRNDLLVMSYFWYKTSYKKITIYDVQTGQNFDFKGTDKEADTIVNTSYDEFGRRRYEKIKTWAPTWKLITILNRTVMYEGDNPLNIDMPPCFPIYWNYQPEIPSYKLRVRSLVRSLRSPQFLLNRRIITNMDISESSLNTGWIHRENSLANEEVLDKVGQGKRVIVKADENEEKPISEILQKIQPNVVPPSDFQIADQLVDLVYKVSGVNEELMGAADDDKAALLSMLRQGAGLITLQKYFDQWDRSLKILGKMEMAIIQANWSPFKVARILGEMPTEQFFNKQFQKYDCVVTEGLNTPTQKQQAFAVYFQMFQAGLPVPPEFLVEILDAPGKSYLNEYMQRQAEQQAIIQQQQQELEMATADAKLSNLQADTMAKYGQAQERFGRKDSNQGLYEERMSEIIHNESLALKEKVEALKNLLDTMSQYGILESAQGTDILSTLLASQEANKEQNRIESHQRSRSNRLSAQNPELYKLLQR